jgi:hypothetical protein
MIEPVEAEFAKPPIYTNKQERAIDDETVEVPGGITGVTGSDSDDNTRSGTPINEKLKGKILVDFEPGTREDPREWGAGRKW